MDGNYNAENVYFSQDLITTTAIGNITLTDGQATIAAAGKNLKEVFEQIFVKEKEPKITQPSVVITKPKAKSYEAGSIIDVAYSATFNSGKYEYGPATGVTVEEWGAEDSLGNTTSTASGTFSNIEVTDDFEYTVYVAAAHSAGAIPVTNLGNETSGQIVRGSQNDESEVISSYRNAFYGTREVKETLTSDILRGLTPSNKALVAGENIVVNIAIGALTTIFAYPATLPDLISITDGNAMDSQIITSFKQEIISVEGANGYVPCDYKVYTIEYANPYDASNYYTFTIGEED